MSEQTATWFNLYDARPAAEVSAESPLAWAYHKASRPSVSQKSRVVLRERAMLGHLILRGGAIVLDEAVHRVLGFGLPGRPNGLTRDESGERSIQWLSPDEWLVIVPGGEEFSLEGKLREALADAHYAIVNVSGVTLSPSAYYQGGLGLYSELREEEALMLFQLGLTSTRSDRDRPRPYEF